MIYLVIIELFIGAGAKVFFEARGLVGVDTFLIGHK